MGDEARDLTVGQRVRFAAGGAWPRDTIGREGVVTAVCPGVLPGEVVATVDMRPASGRDLVFVRWLTGWPVYGVEDLA